MINADRTVVATPAIRKNYRTKAVYDALDEVFGPKCYLCEATKKSIDNFEIEHFIPHKGDETLKFDWDNLFPACGGSHEPCNQIKGVFEEPILNPCNPAHDVEKEIVYELTKIKHEPRFFPNPTSTNLTLATNTCNLLNKIHYGENPKMSRKTAALRENIRNRTAELFEEMMSEHKAIINQDALVQTRALDAIRRIVSRRAPFTMLMRSVAAEHGYAHLFD